MDKTNNNYIASLDFLRSIAAFSVALFHFSHANPNYLSEGNYIKTIGAYGYLGVEIFFVISGFVIPYSISKYDYKLKSFFSFMAKRMVRIEPPYIISIFVVIVMNYLSTKSDLYRGQSFNLDVIGAFLHIGYLNDLLHYDWISPVYWTLGIEFQFYIIIALLFPLLRKGNVIVFTLVIIGLNTVDYVVPINARTFFDFTFIFTAGLLCYKIYTNEKNEIYYAFIFIVLILIGLFHGIAVLLAVLCSVFCILFVKKDFRFFKIFANVSFSFYLLHSVVGNKLLNLSVNFVQDDFARSLMVGLAFLLAFFVSYVYYVVIEKPCLQLSKKIEIDTTTPKDKKEDKLILVR